MNKKVTLHGIELSLPRYNAASESLFDYLDDVVSLLEKGLNKNDENFRMSINVDFKGDKPPRHKIYANGNTSKRTKEKVTNILRKTATRGFDSIAGSVTFNLMVGDRNQ